MLDPTRGNTPVHASRHAPIYMGSKHGGKRAFLDLNIHPRSYLMKRTMLNFVLPTLALGAIVVTLFYPKPSDLQDAVSQVTPPSFIVEASAAGAITDVRPLVEDFADVVPGLQQTLDDNADCFVNLDQADQAKLERCAPAVTQLIAQVVAYQDNPVVVRALQTEGNHRFVQQLQVAAVEVCRSLWAQGDTITHGLDTPACQVAQVQLAPDYGK